MAVNLGLLGFPLKHSFSPYLHSYFLANCGINGGYTYFAMQERVELPVLMHFLERFSFTGLNITSPLKQAIIEHVQDADELVREIGCANVINMTKNGWVAHNTDVSGFEKLLESNNVALSGKNILLMGGGGVASAVVYALRKAGIDSIAVANRAQARVDDLRARYSDMDIKYFRYQSLKEEQSFDIIINCSSADWGNKIWLDHFWMDKAEVFGGHIPETVIDLQYGKEETGFLAQWSSPNKYDGFAMLVEQAARSFEIWFGILPEYDLQKLKEVYIKN